MKIEKLTKPQVILYWMTICSAKQGILSKEDCEALLKYKAFKDSKSISNALYQLHKAGYAVKHDNCWCITSSGVSYIESIINSVSNASSAPKTSEWTDADFGITPEVRAYIDKLENENAHLKQELDAANLQVKTCENEILDIRHNVSLYAGHVSALCAVLKRRNIAYDELLEKNMKLKARVDELNAQIQMQHTPKSDVARLIDACNDFVKSFRIES